MKLLIPLMLLALATMAVRAAEPKAPVDNPREMAALEMFLSLTDEELDQMVQVIARIRAMDTAGRDALLVEIRKFRSLPASQRHQLRQGWGVLEDRLQEAWRRMMHSASEERRSEIQRQLQSLAPEERTALRRKLAEEFLQKELAPKRTEP
jgi:hypothetical protein